MNFSYSFVSQNFFKKGFFSFGFKFIFVLFFVSFMIFSVSAATSYDYAVDNLKNYQMEEGSMKSSHVATAYSLFVFYDFGYSKDTKWTVKAPESTFQGGVQKMIDWVLKTQKSNGSWANNPRTTAMLVKGLVNFGIKGQQLDHAIDYLKTKDPSKPLINDAYSMRYICVDEICNKAYYAMAFEAVGDPEANDLFSELEDLQFKYDSRDSIFDDKGGWARTSDSFSKANLTSTISVLYALTHTKASFDRETAKAFILSNQSTDGGWSPNLTGMTIEETSLAVFDLSKLGSGKSSPEMIQNMTRISGISDSVQSFDNGLFFAVAHSGYSKITNAESLKPESENYYPVPAFSVQKSVFVGKEATFDASGSTDDTG
ncbi:MAG: terpene cyclase/mutase family protein, partial [Candidatus Diapherotrites archaeon]|nr:terpene cyclase/mutase family protein [Candidatus Diapherotrites archaeon]